MIFRRSTTIVTFPIAGTYIDAFCFTSGEKFFSDEKLMQTAPLCV